MFGHWTSMLVSCSDQENTVSFKLSMSNLQTYFRHKTLCEFFSLLSTKVSWGDRGGPLVRHHWWPIPFLPLSSPFSIRCRGRALSFQYPCQPRCLLTRASLPAWWHEAWWPVVFLLGRLWKRGWIWTRENTQLPKAFVSCFVLIASSSILLMNIGGNKVRWKFSYMIYFL